MFYISKHVGFSLQNKMSLLSAAVIWLEYCRYGVKHNTFNHELLFVGRCRHGFTDGRERNFCFVFIGFQEANDGRTACSNLQSGIIDIQSDDDNIFLFKLSGISLSLSLPL